MNAAELRELTAEKREEHLEELRTELIQLQGQAASGTPPENPGRIRAIKKTIARIHTVAQEESQA